MEPTEELGLAGSIIVVASCFVFMCSLFGALFMKKQIFSTISYISCLFLPFGFILMITSLIVMADPSKIAFSIVGIVFSGIYAVFISIVYYSQLTFVIKKQSTPEILKALDFVEPGSLMFSYDLYGYGMMAISTFFSGYSLPALSGAKNAFKWMMMLHGIFCTCILVPPMSTNSNQGNGGIYALLGWCVYFIALSSLGIYFFTVH